ncbi:hypothetical protein GH733_007499 [Mirounga leonina]|nr:hypothetical protein GH733_007499 [Mirounga leonina]
MAPAASGGPKASVQAGGPGEPAWTGRGRRGTWNPPFGPPAATCTRSFPPFHLPTRITWLSPAEPASRPSCKVGSQVPTCHLPHISPGPHLGGRGFVGVAVVCVTAGASAGVWDCHVALLLMSALGLGRQLLPEPDLSGLGTVGSRVCSYECSPGQARRSASSTKPRAPAVFSVGYKGCHVLEKDGRSHLRVLLEAVLPDGRVDATQDSSGPAPPPHPRARLCLCNPCLAVPRTWTHHLSQVKPQWGTLEHRGVDEPPYPGVRLTPGRCQVSSRPIPCGVRSSEEACLQAGCCFDNGGEIPCYYGNTATVQCFRNGHFVLVVSRETALAHGITLANIHMACAPTSCSPAQETGSFVVFRCPFSPCGTTVQVAGNQLIYENQLSGPLRLQLQIAKGKGSLGLLFLPASPHTAHRGSRAPLPADETFCSYYGEGDYPLMRLLREPVPVGVWLLQRTDPSLAPLLHRARPPPAPAPSSSLSEWQCPFDGDSYRFRLVALDGAELSFPSHYQRFIVATFALLDPGSQRPLRGWGRSAYKLVPQALQHPASYSRQRSQTGLCGRNSTFNANPGPLLWVVLLVAVALVLGVGVFMRLSRAQRRSSSEGNGG